MVAPALSIASPMPGCSQNSSALGKTGCEQPSFLCGFGSSFHLLSGGVLASVRNHDFSKGAQYPILGVAPLGSSGETSLAANHVGVAFRTLPAQKVSIHLFNSVLNL